MNKKYAEKKSGYFLISIQLFTRVSSRTLFRKSFSNYFGNFCNKVSILCSQLKLSILNVDLKICHCFLQLRMAGRQKRQSHSIENLLDMPSTSKTRKSPIAHHHSSECSSIRKVSEADYLICKIFYSFCFNLKQFDFVVLFNFYQLNSSNICLYI